MYEYDPAVLTAALTAGDIHRVQDLIAGLDLANWDVSLGRSPLELSVLAGSAEAVRIILTQTRASESLNLALWLAATTERVNLLREMVAAGADIHSKSHELTILFMAVDLDHHDLIRESIECGAYVNSRNLADGWTPISWAAEKGYVGAVRTLLAHGADPYLENRCGVSAWTISERASRRMIRILIDLHLRLQIER